MTKLYNRSIFIFRRDYRLEDNIGLINALYKSDEVVPIFIFTKEQIVNNSYKSSNAIQFMVESLKSLEKLIKNQGGKLYFFFEDKPEDCLEHIIKDIDIDAIFLNIDYTPYSVKRDDKIKKFCEKNNIIYEPYEDILLNPVKSILNGSGEVYTKFTPYFMKARSIKIAMPLKNKYVNYDKPKLRHIIDIEEIEKYYDYNENLSILLDKNKSIHENCNKILKNIKKFKNYNKDRNDLSLNTTKLSAYIKFGISSIREIYYTFKEELGNNNDLIKQLYWRDFYYNIAYTHPYVFGQAMKKNYNNIKWTNNKKLFKLWCTGNTGFPVVDACMRELNNTGYMHNRGRLIVSNFLIKVLDIDWRLGEKYFATKLVDYDPSVNNGNWQWGASTGADSQPYFRVFNPWLQGEKFDKDCEYIKKWVPELEKVDCKMIHKWYDYYDTVKIKYPEPCLTQEEYKKSIEKVKKKYAKN
jgi:deoxyribodipyrimidine photo-lyase